MSQEEKENNCFDESLLKTSLQSIYKEIHNEKFSIRNRLLSIYNDYLFIKQFQSIKIFKNKKCKNDYEQILLKYKEWIQILLNSNLEILNYIKNNMNKPLKLHWINTNTNLNNIELNNNYYNIYLLSVSKSLHLQQKDL